MSLDSVLARIDADIEKSTDRLIDLLRIRSISTDPAYADKVLSILKRGDLAGAASDLKNAADLPLKG